MKLAFRIAFKFLTSSKGQSTLIICGIAIGITVQLFIGLLIQGLQSDLVDKTIGSTSHITLSQSEETFIYDEDIEKTLFENSEVIKVSPVLSSNGLLSYNNEDGVIIVNGLEFDENSNIINLEEKLVEGKLPLNDNEIVVSIYFDKIKVGDNVDIVKLDGKTSFKVVGIFDYGNTNINEKFVYTNLETLQLNFNLNNRVSYIETQIDSVFESEEIAKQIGTQISTNYNIVTWQQINSDLLSALSSQSLSSYIIQVCVIISVALAISSVLIISVVQKSKQIGILKAMGLTNRGISQVFLFQGLMLGIFGSILGLLLGSGLLLSFVKFAVDESGDPVINITFNIGFMAISFAVGVLSALFASLIPARKSKKLSAMEVISNG